LYKKAAKKLAEHGISLAMCDAPKNKVIKEKYEMKEYPVMKWFRPDKSSDDYKGDKSMEAVVDYVTKKHLPPTFAVPCD